MLPSLNFGMEIAGSKPTAHVLPPPRFRPAGRILSAGFLPLTNINVGHSAAHKRGLAYEQSVFELLEATFGNAFMPNPWLWFRDNRGYRRCQPDGLLFFPGRVVIVEVKLSHVAAAYWQLRRLYAPVIEHLCPQRKIELLEITRSYDPAVALPELVGLVDDLFSIETSPLGTQMKVFSWKS